MSQKPQAEVVRSQVAELECVQIQLKSPVDGEVQKPELLVVLCHGYGASGEDLVPCAGEILSCMPHEIRHEVRFLFPAAPIVMGASYGMDSRAWWPIDMIELERAMQSGKFRELRTNDLPEMDAARHKLEATIETVLNEHGLNWKQCVVGGFSQGSMVTTDLTLNLSERPAGLIVWSGTVVREAKWKSAIEQRPLQIPVIQSHGRQDQILPFAGAELLRDLLTKGKADVQFLPFHGPHTIPPDGISQAAILISELVNQS